MGLPCGQFLRCPVALGVALVVAVPPVGGRLDHGRSAAGPGGAHQLGHDRRRGHDVVAVDGDVADAVPGGALLQRGGMLGRRRARTRRSRCSHRRRSSAAPTPRPGSSLHGTRPVRRRRRRRTPPPRSRPPAVARRSRRPPRWAGRPPRCRWRRRSRASGSAMCMEPPRPRLVPWSLPMSSANIPSGSSPLARQWPWPRWVEVMASVRPSGQQAPTAVASCPIERCTKPGISPSR